ncbi:MAG: hypothetical protein AAB438_01100 [Patescibacteria group bacterium]
MFRKTRILSALLFLSLLFSGCSVERLKVDLVNFLDFIQILLSLDGWLKIAGCIAIIVLLSYIFGLLSYAIKYTKKGAKITFKFLWQFFVLRIKKRKWRLLIFATALWIFWSPVHNFIEWAQQKLDPVYMDQFSGLPEDQLISVFEQNIVGDEYIRKIVIDSVHATAKRLSASPLTFYSPALFECSLNPLIVRTDRVAASWSQFTAKGLQGIKYEGRTYKLSEVISWCENKQIQPIMGLSNAYHMHWLGDYSKNHQIEAIDVYLCLFAPSLIGERGETKIYGKWDKNPQNYLQNQPFDGWYMDGAQIMHNNSHCDGIITVQELLLAMEAKKATMIKKHFKRFSQNSSHQNFQEL